MAVQTPDPELGMSKEREVGVLASVVLGMLLAAGALIVIDAFRWPGFLVAISLAGVTLVLVLGPAGLEAVLKRARDRRMAAGRPFPLHRVRQAAVGLLWVAAAGVMVWILFLAQGV